MEAMIMKNENTIYAAYGSKLNLEQMAQRCPNATILGTGELVGYRLLFRGGSYGAVATVEPKKGESVPVLLWDITPRDEAALDRYEGWPTLYRKETGIVICDGEPVEAMIYIMNEGRALGMPSDNYYYTIAEGYDSAGFDIKVLSRAVRLSRRYRKRV
jgi:gamma-glutamylcyclotransferase (GGCT)/AIG2-like uncharacterized protein YtfP